VVIVVGIIANQAVSRQGVGGNAQNIPIPGEPLFKSLFQRLASGKSLDFKSGSTFDTIMNDLDHLSQP